MTQPIENRLILRYILEAHVPEVLTGKDKVELVVNYYDDEGKVRRTVEVPVGVPLAKPSIAPSELDEVQAICVPFEKLDPVDIKVMGDYEREMTRKVRKEFENRTVRVVVEQDDRRRRYEESRIRDSRRA